MNAVPSNLVAIGPWCVEARLTTGLTTGLPYLSLETGTAEWVSEEEKYKRWEGSQAEAEKHAATYAGVATPKKWVTVEEGRRWAAAKEARRAESGGDAMGHPHSTLRPGRHDRAGEVIES